MGGGRAHTYPDNTLSPSLPSQRPIINSRVLTGGSRSCNTTAISGLWNGGGPRRKGGGGRGQGGERRMRVRGVTEVVGEGVGRSTVP